MNNYFDTFAKKDCNGCGACALRCPKGAIKMQEDEEGFLYPVIDESKCIHCGLCKKICSNIPVENQFKAKVYAAKNKNNERRLSSTSGGIFNILAEHIISKNGIIFGVKYDENLKVVHDYAESTEDCKKFSISKYVRSDLKGAYQEVEKFLKLGKYVLFTGTPCQNYGLKKYLQKDYSNLILCEIVCHSNPSPKVFEIYKKNIEKINNKKIKNYYFRSKNPNLSNPYVEFDDGKIKEYLAFNTAFNSMLISRPACSNCRFCDTNRKADITIGDFWGVEKFFPGFDDKKGVSLLCINSLKGMNIFDEIKNKITYQESNIENAFKYNHHSNVPVHKNRDMFFKGISDGTINETNIIKYMNKYNQKTLYKKVIGKLKHILKK